MMDWSNEMVLEFLECYENEPVIWNPYHENHKKKQCVSEAWLRIKQNISWKCSVDELKKKKDSLMAYYRIHIAKMKKSKATDGEDVKTISWFAFATMHNFLGPIYECNKSIYNTEIETCKLEFDEPEMVSTSLSPPPSSTTETYREPEPNKPPESYRPPESSRPPESYRQPIKRKQVTDAKEMTPASHQMDEDTLVHIKKKRTIDPVFDPDSLNEYELFGNLVVKRILKIPNMLDREILMNDINNLIFKAVKASVVSQKSNSAVDLCSSCSQAVHPKTELETHASSP